MALALALYYTGLFARAVKAISSPMPGKVFNHAKAIPCRDTYLPCCYAFIK